MSSKPRKIAKSMPAPERRNFVVLAMVNRSQKAGGFRDLKKAASKNACRGKVDF